MFKTIKTNLVFHPRFNVITFMTEVEILDGVLKIFTSNLNPHKIEKKKKTVNNDEELFMYFKNRTHLSSVFTANAV